MPSDAPADADLPPRQAERGSDGGGEPGELGAIKRLGAMLVAPRATLRRIAKLDEGDFFEVLMLLVAVRFLLAIPLLYKFALLAPEAPSAVGRRLANHLWTSLRHDVLVFCFAAAAFAVFGRFLSPHRIHARAAVAAVAYAAVPYVAMQAVGGIVAYGALLAGAQPWWWLPSYPVDALYVLMVDNQVSMARFGIKCFIAYAIPLALLLDLGRYLFTPPAEDAGGGSASPGEPTSDSGSAEVGLSSNAPAAGPASAAFPIAAGAARMGALALGIGLAVTAVAGVARLVDVEDELRPLLPGDELPHEVGLPELLPGSTRPGKVLTMGQLRGNVVVVDFWASWCAPCMRAMPDLAKLQQELGPRGVRVVGINREPRALKEASEAFKVVKGAFQSLIDVRAGTPQGFGERIGLQSLPTTLVVDRSGIVRHLHLGYTPAETLRAEVEALLP